MYIVFIDTTIGCNSNFIAMLVLRLPPIFHYVIFFEYNTRQIFGKPYYKVVSMSRHIKFERNRFPQQRHGEEHNFIAKVCELCPTSLFNLLEIFPCT